MKNQGTSVAKRRGKVAVYNRFCAVDHELGKDGVLVASSARNCDFENGALRSGYGTKEYRVESDCEKQLGASASLYGHPKMVFTLQMKTSDGLIKRTVGAQAGVDRIFVYNIDQGTKTYVSIPSTLIKALSYVYPDDTVKMIFCCVDQLFFYDFTNKVTKILTETLTGACLFHERLFVSNKYSLKYSVPMDVGNFEKSLNGGGEITFHDDRGEIVWLESFGESVYIFFQYGIAKLTASGEGREFVIEDIPYNGGHILSRTVCAYENKLVFASYDGIFVFDGKKCSKLKGFRYSPLKNYNQFACAACVDGRYFLYYLDEKKDKRSTFVDLEDELNGGECFIMYGLNQSGGKALVSSDYVYSYLDRDGSLPKNEEYFFNVERCDFSSKEEKSLKYLCLEGVGACSLTIKGRTGSRTLNFDLGQRQAVGQKGGVDVNGVDIIGTERKLVGLKGREFSFEFALQNGCVIRKMTVEYDEVGGVK